MNNVEKVESGEYKLNTEYRILYNGTKYKGILVQIGSEEECTNKANRLMTPKEAEKVLRELNKNGVKSCKIQLLETEIDKMTAKIKEKDTKIKDLEKQINDLNLKYVYPRTVKCTEEECILLRSPRVTNHNSLKAFIEKTAQISERRSIETLKEDECLVSKSPTFSVNPISSVTKTFADKTVQVNDRRSRLQNKLQMLEEHVNDTARIIKEKDQRISELEKSVEDLNKKMKISILTGLKRERGMCFLDLDFQKIRLFV